MSTLKIIERNAEGNEERHVVVDGHAFVLERFDPGSEWHVCWRDAPPEDCHPELGTLSWEYSPGATPTTNLSIANIDMVDTHRKEELLARVAVEAGLTLRPVRHVGKPDADA